MRRRWTILIAALSVAALLLTGCLPADEGNGDGGNDGASTETPADGNGGQAPVGNDGSGQDSAPVDRDPVKEGTLMVEGMPEPTTLHLFETADGWLLQFSTYYPEDFETESVSSGEGTAVRFVSNFAGNRNENAYLTVFAFPADTSEEDALKLAAEVAGEMGIEEAPEEDHNEHPWALAHYHGTTSDREHGAWLSVGKHDDAYFYVYAQFPLEMGDGFGPRAHLILDEWIWSDTGEPLAP